MSTGAAFFAHKKRITERNSHLAGEASGRSISKGCYAKTERRRQLAGVGTGRRGTKLHASVAGSRVTAFLATAALWELYFTDNPRIFKQQEDTSSSPECKNVWTCTSISVICLRGVELRDSFTFTYRILNNIKIILCYIAHDVSLLAVVTVMSSWTLGESLALQNWAQSLLRCSAAHLRILIKQPPKSYLMIPSSSHNLCKQMDWTPHAYCDAFVTQR
jgi:hypothetical protein